MEGNVRLVLKEYHIIAQQIVVLDKTRMFFLHKARIFVLCKKKTVFMYKKKILLLCKKRISSCTRGTSSRARRRSASCALGCLGAPFGDPWDAFGCLWGALGFSLGF